MTFSRQRILAPLDFQNDVELALLLCCARPHIAPAVATQIRSLVQQVNWQKLVPLAEWHSVLPLVYQALNTVCPEEVPTPVLKQLRHSFHAIALNNQLLMQTLLNLLKQFEAKGVPVLAFKGPLLATSVYGDLNLRQFSDLDLLVPKQAVESAKALLLEQNYEPYQMIGWQVAFTHPTSGVSIDLHFALAPRYFRVNLQFEQLRSRLQAREFNTEQILCLSPVDLLLILCISFCRDRHECKSRLIQLSDVAQLIQAYPELDWQAVLRQARRLGILRIVLVTLALAQSLLDVSLPDIIQSHLDDNPSIDALINPVESWLWHELHPRSSGACTEIHDHDFYFKLRERWIEKTLYFLHYASLPVEHPSRLPLPKAFDHLYQIRCAIRQPFRRKSLIRKGRLFLRLPPQQGFRLLQALVLFPIVAIGLHRLDLQRIQAILAALSPLPSSLPLATQEQLEQTVHLVAVAARQYSPRWANCLKRSLVLWYLLRRQGISSDLRIGVRREQGEFQAHAWVEYQGRVLNDSPDIHGVFVAFEAAISSQT